MGEDIVAFVHAKGTSRRLPGKNTRKLGGKPLFCHAISNAMQSERVTKVVIDSDCDEILRIGKEMGAIPLKRPQELATNFATADDLIGWAAGNYPDSELLLQVVATSPFLLPSSIDRAINLIYEEGVDSVAGVYSTVVYQWQNGRPAYFSPDGKIPNSFEMAPIVYETSSLNVIRTSWALENKRRINTESCYPCFLSKIETIDIDTLEDFEFADIVWRGMNNGKKPGN